MKSAVQKVVRVALVGVFVLAVVSSYHYLELDLRVEFAREQVKTFAQMREQAREEDVSHGLQSLEYAFNYYPTGTKQGRSSATDQIVETTRKIVIEDIIATLRQKTGKDFGPDPEAWIKNRESLAATGPQ